MTKRAPHGGGVLLRREGGHGEAGRHDGQRALGALCRAPLLGDARAQPHHTHRRAWRVVHADDLGFMWIESLLGKAQCSCFLRNVQAVSAQSQPRTPGGNRTSVQG